ncbi:MurR/RpiR family transcriptional regulator [Bacillus salacetis]|uniref:MurR/RpiR family transcriptional regulator n=1 Tax=Bacillus salacetis TaxID=2315464 RepID=A0A3A1QYU0_9BACI|nr:MurR/RpiR family transcriptional regulator [Bacillus salacetis]RIW34270.1 MurR/RpiR family transcriptional regulator [Bacillus salacetis]
MGKVLDRFSKFVGELTYSEKHVLYYVEEHLEKAKQESLTKMAESNNVSTTTIIRMCHKLGLEGFSEFKYLLKDIDENIRPAENMLERYSQDMEKTLSSLRVEELEKISGQIQQADRVMIVAVGLTKMMGEYFSKLFMQVNKPTSYVYESHIIDLLPNMVQPKDLVVFISSSGETKTIVNAAEKIRFKSADTLAITNSADSTLARTTRNSISADVQRVQFGGYDLTARSTIVVLIDLIFEFYLKKVMK